MFKYGINVLKHGLYWEDLAFACENVPLELFIEFARSYWCAIDDLDDVAVVDCDTGEVLWSASLEYEANNP